MLAYVAGLFDGEGCFCLRRGKSGRPFPVAHISNTDRPLLVFVKEFFDAYGVKSHLYDKGAVPEGNKTGWQLVVCKRASLLILCALLKPYLHLKSLHADICASYSRLRIDEGKFGRKYIDEESTLVCALKALNKRGI